jgi:hypothetical protein
VAQHEKSVPVAVNSVGMRPFLRRSNEKVCQYHDQVELCGKWVWNKDHYDAYWANDPPQHVGLFLNGKDGNVMFFTDFMSPDAPTDENQRLYRKAPGEGP